MTNDAPEALLAARAAVLAEIEDANRRIHSIGQALEAWMKSEQAQERVVGGFKITYRPPIIWQKERLTPLLEVVPLEQLVESKAYTPEH